MGVQGCSALLRIRGIEGGGACPHYHRRIENGGGRRGKIQGGEEYYKTGSRGKRANRISSGKKREGVRRMSSETVVGVSPWMGQW